MDGDVRLEGLGRAAVGKSGVSLGDGSRISLRFYYTISTTPSQRRCSKRCFNMECYHQLSNLGAAGTRKPPSKNTVPAITKTTGCYTVSEMV